MKFSNLPSELVTQIFSTGLEQSDLACIVRTNRLFHELARPLLYRSVTFHTLEQCEQFVACDRRGRSLVKAVSIVGKKDPWEEEDLDVVATSFNLMNQAERGAQEAGCVKKLLQGGLVRTEQLESIYILNVLENPNELLRRGFSVSPRKFTNLTTLSIVSHRGGSNLWDEILTVCPFWKLEFFTICEITTIDRSVSSPVNADPTSLAPTFMASSTLDFALSTTLVDLHTIEDTLGLSELLSASPLKLLVSPRFNYLYPTDPFSHLSIITSDSPLELFTVDAVVHISWKLNVPAQIDIIFDDLSQAAKNPALNLQYLALPVELPTLSQKHREVINELGAREVWVDYEGPSGCSLVPPKFLEFVTKRQKRQKKLKEESKAKSSPD